MLIGQGVFHNELANLGMKQLKENLQMREENVKKSSNIRVKFICRR